MKDGNDEREPGECSPSPSRTPSPEHVIVKARRKENGDRRAQREEGPKNESVIELIDLEASDDDADIEVISEVDVSQDTDDLFVLDTEGAEIVEVEEEVRKTIAGAIATSLDGSEVEERKATSGTSQKKKRDDVFDMTRILTNDGTAASPSEEKKESVFKMSCFNCGGGHTLQQCGVPLNQRRIAASRAAHYSAKRSLQQQERYTTAGDNKLGGSNGVRPGEISGALREALGIGEDDIPEWIYRMRRRGFVDGYPPGYLTEALDACTGENSVLEFHTDDKSLGTPRSSHEDVVYRRHTSAASVEEDKKRKAPTISADKIIAYPGFNYYNRYLRDRERFRVPRFDEYVRYLQAHVTRLFNRRSRERYLGRNRKRRRNRNELEGDHKRHRTDADDSIVVINDGPDKSELMSPSSTQEIVLESDAERSTTPSLIQSSDSSPCLTLSSQSLGSSIEISLGAPVVCRKEHDKKKPSLENFRADIVPFEAVEECVENRGFFRKLMAKIRKKKV